MRRNIAFGFVCAVIVNDNRITREKRGCLLAGNGNKSRAAPWGMLSWELRVTIIQAGLVPLPARVQSPRTRSLPQGWWQRHLPFTDSFAQSDRCNVMSHVGGQSGKSSW